MRKLLDSEKYRMIIQTYLDTHSVKKTAEITKVSEVKVRRVLITEGVWSSDSSIRVGHYFEKGAKTEEIAEILRISVKAVQQYLPYKRGLYQDGDPTSDSRYSKEYRQRISVAQEKTLKRKQGIERKEGWEDPDMANAKKIKCRKQDIIRLHLELIPENYGMEREKDDGHGEWAAPHYDEEEKRVLKSYGEVKFGDTISRDLLVPVDMPLYAVHYAAQRAFGWENSHLHRFELPYKRYLDVTDENAGKWCNLVGVLFRSPFMDEEDEFWADDYEGGSFLVWLRKKYTGPYLSLCHGEGIFQCKADIERFIKKYPLIQIDYYEHDGEVYPGDARPAEEGAVCGIMDLPEDKKDDHEQDTCEEEMRFWNPKVVKREIVELCDAPVEMMNLLFADGFPYNILERLPLGQILALHDKHFQDGFAEGEAIRNSYDKFMNKMQQANIEKILKSRCNTPVLQPDITSPTDVLYYYYDFGDGWKIRITGSKQADDLLEQGRISQQELESAFEKVGETYRPVCIASDGLPVVDDVGGIYGFVCFLRSINPAKEKDFWGKDNLPDNSPYEDKKSSLEWAKSLGWKEKVKITM